MGLDFSERSSSVTDPAYGCEEFLPEELAMNVVDVVISILLREPNPGVLIVITVDADEGGQAGDAGADDGAGDHALLDLVNLPDVILDAGKGH